MRFHKFETPVSAEVWLDLDAVQGLREAGRGRTEILIGSWTHLVPMPLEDVLALVSPPAAPDTYEEGLAKHMDALRKQGGQGPLNEWNVAYAKTHPLGPTSIREADRAGRLDELERVQRWLDQPLIPPDNIAKYLAKRRAKIEQDGF